MNLTPRETTVGFIGTGVMGSSMALRLLQAGYRLEVYNRTRAKTQSLVDSGARQAPSVPELSKVSDVIITMIGYPRDVEEVYLGPEGIVSHAKAGAYLVDMTTSSPALAKKIFAAAKAKGLHALDAPVSGGDIGARDGMLSIMVGGDEKDFGVIRPLFEIMGQNIVYQGQSGSGQHTKMCNQIAIASNMMGVCEAVSYARKAGLNPEQVLKSISSGAAGSWSLSHLAPRMMQGDMEPGFYIKHFIKDMTIALNEAEQMHLSTPGLKLAKELYEQLSNLGYDSLGTQALYKLYE